MTRDIQTLCAIWREVHSNPAWLALLVEQLSLDTDDEECLGEIDDAFLRDMRIIERQWRKELRGRMAWSREGVDNKWANERRREYLTQKITDLERLCVDNCAQLFQMSCNFLPSIINNNNYFSFRPENFLRLHFLTSSLRHFVGTDHE